MSEQIAVGFGFEGFDVRCLNSTGLVYISTRNGVVVYKGTRPINVMGWSRAMAVSPSGKYIVTGGGVYDTFEPFNRIQPLGTDIDSATFLDSDDKFVTVTAGEISIYSRSKKSTWERVFLAQVENEYVRSVVYGQGVVAALTKSGRVLSLDAEDMEKKARLLAQTVVSTREQWKEEGTRLVSDGKSCCVVSGNSIWKMNWKRMGEVVISYAKHEVDKDSRDYELIVFRGSCRTSKGLYSVSSCGKYLNMPSADPEILKQTKTGRRCGVVTRSQTRANEKLKSVIKTQGFF